MLTRFHDDRGWYLFPFWEETILRFEEDSKVHYHFVLFDDFKGYLKALGMARTAEVKRDARIGEAEARSDSQIKEAIAEEERLAARLVNDIEIAKAQRDFELKKAAYDQEVQAKVSRFRPYLSAFVFPSIRMSLLCLCVF